VADQQNEGFVRQRRNLMIVSLVLLFSEATDLKVEKLSAFGTELLVGQPQAVTTALWIAALYWLIRFYQYSHDEYTGAISLAVKDRVVQISAPVALRKLLHEEPKLIVPGTVKAIPITAPSIFESSKLSNVLEVQLQIGTPSANEGIGSRTIRIDGADLYWLRLRGWIYVILHTALFTELVLPYMVFALPVLYAGYKAIIQV